MCHPLYESKLFFGILTCSTITTRQISRSLKYIFLSFVLVSKVIVYSNFSLMSIRLNDKLKNSLLFLWTQITLTDWKHLQITRMSTSTHLLGRLLWELELRVSFCSWNFTSFLGLERISEARLATVRCRRLLKHGTQNCQLFIISSSPSLNPH